jgi:hypothetical protein
MIKAKLKLCAGCGEDRLIWKNFEGQKFCKDCWMKKTPTTKPVTSKLIKPVSDKRKPLDQLYSKLRKQFLDQPENSTCRAKLHVCTHHTGQDLTIHHTRGRGKYYLDSTTWIPLCLSCHRWVEEHPADAKEMFLTESRV